MLTKYLKPYAYLMLICSIYPCTGADGVIYKFEDFTDDELGGVMVMTSTQQGTRPANSYFGHLEKGETTASLDTYLPGGGTNWATLVGNAKSVGLPITFKFYVQTKNSQYKSTTSLAAADIAKLYENCNVKPEETMNKSELHVKAIRNTKKEIEKLESDLVLYSPTEEECKAQK